eukprot:TRINITY_DN9474_c0_g2_i1.p2 TRINITY_DN9474_c0_g2~~TRINITY_DN9474_c0_g2_i1.p2  ORF type:complete len:100 (-),score=22.89 TRINITY_DN9474_c0_g2_i1:158-457(-)
MQMQFPSPVQAHKAVSPPRPSQDELVSRASMLNSVETRTSGGPDLAAMEFVARVCLEVNCDVDRVAAALGCSADRLRRCPPRDLEDFARKVLLGVYSED